MGFTGLVTGVVKVDFNACSLNKVLCYFPFPGFPGDLNSNRLPCGMATTRPYLTNFWLRRFRFARLEIIGEIKI